jgi:hypothetical protein
MAIRHVVAVGLLALVLGGCGNDAVQGSANASGSAPTGETKKDDAPVSTRDPKQDVKLLSCEASKWSLTANVEVTNRNSTTSEYYGQIYFIDAAGTRITEGEFNSGNVEPGAVRTKEIPGQNLTHAEKVTCEIGWIKLGDINN